MTSEDSLTKMPSSVFSVCCLQSPEKIRSQEIDEMIEKDKRILRKQVKLLLLGAGESGKSTFLKQMKIIHGVKFEPELIAEYQKIIYQNIIRGMKVLIDAKHKLGIPWGLPENQKFADLVMNYDGKEKLDTRLFIAYAPSLNVLWKDGGIRATYEMRKEFQISESVYYFLENLERISRIDYLPTNKDILHSRKATKSVSECTININDVPFKFVDVGGQRSQRQKWFQCFESVTSILFLVSSSEFDQVLVEDRKTNRLEESRNIFDTIVNNVIFENVSFILFLNKTDLLEEKIKSRRSNIRLNFPHFEGDPYNISDVQAFVLQFFIKVKRDPQKPLFYHFTTAVDTENINVVFNSVKETIFRRNLQLLMIQ